MTLFNLCKYGYGQFEQFGLHDICLVKLTQLCIIVAIEENCVFTLRLKNGCKYFVIKNNKNFNNEYPNVNSPTVCNVTDN